MHWCGKVLGQEHGALVLDFLPRGRRYYEDFLFYSLDFSELYQHRVQPEHHEQVVAALVMELNCIMDGGMATP